MPYGSIQDLPASVRNSLPKHGQEIFLAAFNSAYEKYHNEERAFKIAWGAVKNAGYKKGDGDKWKKVGNLQKMAVFTNIELINKTHDAILQTLNREIGGYYFAVEAFQKNIDDWQDIPIIYASDHPDMNLFVDKPIIALEKIKGRIVGSVQMPNIETVGHPRMMGNLKIDDDEVNKLIELGKISHSTGFIGHVDENKQITEVTPNHVLVFLEDEKNIPKDRGAFILNKTETEMTEDKETELAKQLEISNKEKETLTGEIESLKKTIADKDEQLKVFAQKEAEALKATRETQWQTIKKSIPVGLTHKAEDEAKLRTEFEADPYGFAVKLTEFKQKQGTELEGEEFQNQAELDEAKDAQKAIDELRELGGMSRIRRG